MKYLKNVSEICESIYNLPVVVFDVNKGQEKVGERIIAFKSENKVKVYMKNKKYYEACEAVWFEDSKKIHFMNYGLIITNSFSMKELEERIEASNSVVIGENQEFVVVIKGEEKCNAMIVKTGNYLGNWCSSKFETEEIDECYFETVLGKEIK